MTTQNTMEQKLSALLNKRDIELPIAKRKLQEDIKKLRKLLAAVEEEESEVQNEINVLFQNSSFTGVTLSNKSILDLPHLAWRIITTQFEGREYCLLNACLSSPSLEDMITNGSPEKKLRLLGEKVFSLLILRHYVSRRDIQNCLNTTSEDLQYFAGCSWWFFRKTLRWTDFGVLTGKSIEFQNCDEIKAFSKQAEQESNKWDFFKDMYLHFLYNESGTKSEYDKFCEAAIVLQKRFGNFITNVWWSDSFPGSQQLHEMCPYLHIIFPRLKQFHCYISSIGNWSVQSISSELNDRTLDPFFTLHDNFCIPKTTAFNKSEGNIYGCSIKSLTLKNAVQLVASTQLTINMSSSDNVVESYDNVLAADPSNFLNVRSLIVEGYTHHFRSIAMLEKFPNLTNVSILVVREMTIPPVINGPGPGLVFPRVKKLTFEIQFEVPLRLDILSIYFPFLRCLTIKYNDDYEVSRLNDRMSNWQKMGHFNNEVIYVYQLYSENRSLNKSNIWSKMQYPNSARHYFCVNVEMDSFHDVTFRI